MKLTVGSLFAGIGGFDLGLERTGGFEVKFQVEIDAYCQRVLAKHWPHVRRYGDIREVASVERVDVLCGGFPCQDISNTGKRAGIDGERSGLWSEYVRLIREVRPRYVLVENVAALLGRGMGRVLGDLSESGYDAEWRCISARDAGAPHLRERVWIVAYPNSPRLQERKYESVAGQKTSGRKQSGCTNFGVPATPDSADSECREFSLGRSAGRIWRGHESLQRNRDWPLTAEPVLDRGADGIPHRLDRLHAIGNAIVPQIAEWIGQRILEREALLALAAKQVLRG